MLYELYTSLTTSCPAYVRHMDYLHEIIAMRGRYNRNRAAWQPHLDNTRAFVLSAAEKCEKRTVVVIFGAGLLLDVPLKELSSMFQEVHLLDIVFLPEVRKRASRFNNVKLIQHDATSIAESLYTRVHQGIRDLPESSPPNLADIAQAGLVVSLNILSQLWVMPKAYALKMLRNLDEEQLDDWCGKIVASHYTFLQSLSLPVCLVADYEYVKRDREGTIVNKGSTVAGLVLPTPDANWTWHIAPRGESSRYVSKELNVGAWQLP